MYGVKYPNTKPKPPKIDWFGWLLILSILGWTAFGVWLLARCAC